MTPDKSLETSIANI